VQSGSLKPTWALLGKKKQKTKKQKHPEKKKKKRKKKKHYIYKMIQVVFSLY
jgi:hypothetical protein